MRLISTLSETNLIDSWRKLIFLYRFFFIVIKIKESSKFDLIYTAIREYLQEKNQFVVIDDYRKNYF